MRADHEQAVLLYTQLLEAWNRRAADDFAALFAPDGNTVGFDGSPLDGREEIAAALGDIFASHPRPRTSRRFARYAGLVER